MTEENLNIEEQNTEETISAEEVKSAVEIEDDANSPYKWYAVRIVSGHENKVKLYLENEIKAEGLEERIKLVVIPYEKVYEVKNGKKRVKLKNFLPGYILINAILNDSIRDFIAKTPSIINMVGVKKGKKLDPIPLSANEVKRIKALLSEENETEKIDINFNVGDAVKVTSGPFNNFNGNILEINPEKMKVKVMVSIFGRKTPIELELTQIERE
ncbi:MAG: transcription termination/antitermination factor NusG [Bacteroidetes bacterium]|nr:transcription termination/antitermination factor NusG [Bacteroidota bacterium]